MWGLGGEEDWGPRCPPGVVVKGTEPRSRHGVGLALEVCLHRDVYFPALVQESSIHMGDWTEKGNV